ncbi:Glycosyltransferase family 29 (sialyltransferase) family protein isoform 1 [Hibiscus syriacus]|uniref:Glycosyltransferase family 29 (Sialyltransferase) family protein isoform 1 n=1 Tax=Hibiscus syriacus TaxID=106335 RepID=A0A6A3A7R1_HIBSY|nr:ankyrin repeat and SAM domain-containing protein 3-like [Hibiscus syriacus]XP_039005206.1 ankyrin repeat and SAM domain-containing protein 3-like [Hibiscus syriacus]KAE8699943.1 Glycosyltransferase family 29 (sialyltransferase) family protein isoform 1 [Hibiscus syriacus]
MADTQPSDCQENAGEVSIPVAPVDAVGPKRQRRPSVRLGDIGGDLPHDTHTRRQSSSASASIPKQWKHHSLNPSAAAASGKSSKNRAVTNLSTEFNTKNQTLDDAREPNNNNDDDTNNSDGVAIGGWRVKDSMKRCSAAAKRVRSNWVSNSNVECEDKRSGSEDTADFDRENSESPLREQSHHGNNQRRPIGTRVSDASIRRHEEDDGIRIWLESLGLGRYAPVFEINEVDEEILPSLTLEDLKDMGINAVGSRRKLFSAIQRLGKGFS